MKSCKFRYFNLFEFFDYTGIAPGKTKFSVYLSTLSFAPTVQYNVDEKHQNEDAAKGDDDGGTGGQINLSG